MVTQVNPAPKTGTQTEAAPAPVGTVKVRWNGATKLRGIKQERTLGNHTWVYDGRNKAGPELSIDADAWAAITPEQRKADGLEEV